MSRSARLVLRTSETTVATTDMAVPAVQATAARCAELSELAKEGMCECCALQRVRHCREHLLIDQLLQRLLGNTVGSESVEHGGYARGEASISPTRSRSMAVSTAPCQRAALRRTVCCDAFAVGCDAGCDNLAANRPSHKSK